MTLDSITAGRVTVCLSVVKYLKCTSVGGDGSTKIVDDLQFLLGVALTFVMVKDITAINANAIFWNCTNAFIVQALKPM